MTPSESRPDLDDEGADLDDDEGADIPADITQGTGRLTPSQEASRQARAIVAAQDAEWKAAQRFLDQSDDLRRRRRRGRGSVVFALRLDPRELEALERRAYAVGNKPSVVARNLIRVGLSRPADLTLTSLAGEAEDLAARLREAASGPALPGR